MIGAGVTYRHSSKFAIELSQDQYRSELKHAANNLVAIIIDPSQPESISFIGRTSNPRKLGANFINLFCDPGIGLKTAYPVGIGNYPTMKLAQTDEAGNLRHETFATRTQINFAPKDLDGLERSRLKAVLVCHNNRQW